MTMKHRAAVLLAALVPLGAQAQFMDMFKNAVSNAAVNAAADKVGQAIRNGGVQNNEISTKPAVAVPHAPAPAAAKADSGAPRCGTSRATPLAPPGPRPETFQPEILWPAEAACPAYSFGDLNFDAAKAQRQKFVDASAVACSDCEGGKDYEAWARHFIGNGESKKFDDRLIALQPGQHVAWKGRKYSGDIVLTGSEPIGRFPCRQYHWTLKDNQSGAVAAEREGLYCQYKGEYSASATWHEVI